MASDRLLATNGIFGAGFKAYEDALCLTKGFWSSCSFPSLPLTSLNKVVVRLAPLQSMNVSSAQLLVTHEYIFG
jgi:hypothetical protein